MVLWTNYFGEGVYYLTFPLPKPINIQQNPTSPVHDHVWCGCTTLVHHMSLTTVDCFRGHNLYDENYLLKSEVQ